MVSILDRRGSWHSRYAWVGAVLVGALGCTAGTSEPPRSSAGPEAVEPSSEPEAKRRELGPLLGGAVVEHAPTPGRYASALSFSQHKFITMEHTVSGSVRGTAVLELRADGSARACFDVHEHSGSSISHYQSHDGKDHHNEHDNDLLVGMSGTWTMVGEQARARVRLDRVAYHSCEVPADAPALPEAHELHCVGIEANAKIPTRALLCGVDPGDRRIGQLSLLLGDSPRAGSWALRRDPSSRGPEDIPEDATPWLLLGEEGLKITGEDQRRGPITLEIEAATVADPEPRPPPP